MSSEGLKVTNNFDFSLLIEKGISQVDQTYVNGNLIGNSYSFIDERNYKIPNQY